MSLRVVSTCPLGGQWMSLILTTRKLRTKETNHYIAKPAPAVFAGIKIRKSPRVAV